MAAKSGRTRETLESLSKDELVARAEALGIDGATKFTRVELIDEITRAGAGGERGLLGRARDLLRDVVEKGLARPAATAKKNGDAEPAAQAVDTSLEPPVPTVTLAEIYLAQGHVARARAILREVLRESPDDAAARALESRLEGAREERAEPVEKGALPDDPYARIGIEPEAFHEPSAEGAAEVAPMLDDAPMPRRYDLDECVALAVDPTTVYVYWEARPATVERARRALRRGNDNDPTSTLRVLVVEPTERGPRVSTRDFNVVDLEYGEWLVRELPPGSIVRAAIGLREGARFLPLAHTPDIEAPASSPSHAIASEVVVWSENGTRPPSGELTSVARPLPRDAGTLGLPPLPEAPVDEITEGRGLSSAELARRARVVRARNAARDAAAAGRPEAQGGASDLLVGHPSSGSWASGR